jgi:Abnormal spindle-like microcephaly-assoc'd, ASPM-SPD-2-Hydin
MSTRRLAGSIVAMAAASLCLAGPALASGITNSSEDLRTGWYPKESTITPGLVTGGTFGQEWSQHVEGQVYAQPLVFEETLLVATERNFVYGLDPSNGAVKWWKELPHPVPWKASDLNCADLAPDLGVTGTPVIDPSTGTAYMTHETYASGESGPARWWMDAIDMSTGAEKPGFPVEISGEAQNIPGVTFNATDELQRPGLLLMEGVVYAAFGSHCDKGTYQGWVFGVSTGGTVKARWASDTQGGGIWQSGAGLTSDGPGRILLATGNGNNSQPPLAGSHPNHELAQAVVRLQVQSNGSLAAVDFFMPYNANSLDTWDADFGSGGVTGLPNQWFGTSSIPHLAVAVGKDGYVYLLNRDNLGGYGEGASGQDAVVQKIGPNGGVWSRPGVWPGEGGWVYIPTASAGKSSSGESGNLDVYSYGLTAQGAPNLHLEAVSSDAFGFSSGAPIITSNETQTGSAVVWMVWSPNTNGNGSELRAYAAKPKAGRPVLLNSWPVGQSSKFSTPGVGLGRLYLGTRDERVLGFGSPVSNPLSGPQAEFPETTIGQSSNHTLTLTANSEVTIESIGAPSDAQFAQSGTASPTPPATLKTGQKMTVPFEFTPKSTGPQAATVQVTLSGGRMVSFSLVGTGRTAGPKLEASPPVVDFGGTTVGETIEESLALRNVGSEPLEIKGWKGLEAPFHLKEPLPNEIEPGQQVLVPIEFSPTANRPYEGTLDLETNTGIVEVGLSGVAAAPGLLQISPEAQGFGAVAVGSEAQRSFTITNVGGLPDKISISKPPIAGEFRATTTLSEGTVIEPGDSIVETVRFAPTTLGSNGDVWEISGEDSGGRRAVGFSGEGVAPPTEQLVSQLPTKQLGVTASSVPAVLAASTLRAGPRWKLPVKVRCPAQASSCRGTITLRTRGLVRVHPGERKASIVTLASANFTIAAGHTVTLEIRLTPRGHALLARLRSVKASVLIASVTSTGAKHLARSAATLRAPLRSSKPR